MSAGDRIRVDGLTDKRYWDAVWDRGGGAGGPRGIRLLHDYRRIVQQRYFRAFLPEVSHSGRLLLEVGCAASGWLPFFAEQLGFRVFGLDYSEEGCRLAREVLASAKIDGDVVCADLFEPPCQYLNRFDVVTSFGLVEHFGDTAGCLRALGRFLKPGGLLFTAVPNLAGAIGIAQRILGPRYLDVHVRMERNTLSDALAAAGFEVVDCRYLQIHDFSLCNLDEGPGIPHMLRSLLRGILKRFAAAVVILNTRLRWYPVNRLTSTYIYSVARLPGSA